MVIIFSDETILDVDNIFLTEGENNLIIGLSGDFANIKEIFKNTEKISTISVDKAEYCGYTVLKSITSFYDGIDDVTQIRVELEYNGLSRQVDTLKSEIENLQSGILELADLLLESEGTEE